MDSSILHRLRWLIDRFRYDPLGYVQSIIRPPLISNDQKSLITAAAKDNSRVSAASGTTTGKTAGLAWLLLWFINTHADARAPCTATKYDQVTHTLWPEVIKWHAHMLPEFAGMIRIQQEKIFLLGHENTSFAWPLAASKERAEAFRGVHAKNVLFIQDEASGIPQEIHDATEQSASTPGCRWIMTGNPTRASGAFYDSHHKHAHLWTTLNFSSLNSPFPSPDYAKRMAQKYGVDSNTYRIGVLGQFPMSDPDTLIPYDWVQEARDLNIEPDKSQPRIAGLDPSGGGSDPVGFAIRQGTIAHSFEEWTANEAMPTVGRILQLWKDRRFDRVVVDALGVGNGVASRLEEQGIPVIPVNVAMRPVAKPECYQLRDELWWHARDWFESRIVRIEPGPHAKDDEYLLKFAHEVSTPKFSFHSTGKNKVEDKDSLRLPNRLGYSPNIADAFCLTFAQGIPIRNSSAQRRPESASSAAARYAW